MASVYSGAGEGRYGTVAVRGQVEFGLQYNYKARALEIHIKQCKDLAPVDAKRNRSDPYVKVYLLPDKSKSGKRKTKVKKHTLNPVFDETLKFHISSERVGNADVVVDGLALGHVRSKRLLGRGHDDFRK
jgi:synaptotagmin-like protein